MIKRRLMATAMTAALITSMFATTAMAEEATKEWNSNGGSATIEGTSSTVEPTIEVELPSDLSFGINPLKLDVSEDSSKPNKKQIVGADYLITNYSNVDVLVKASTKVTAESTVDLKTEGAYDDKSFELSPTKDKKAVLLIQALATAITVGTDGSVAATYGDFTASAAASNDATSVNGKAGAILGTSDTDILFKLAKNDGTLKSANIGAFTFDGSVDPNAAFTDGDVKVTTVFTMSTLTDSQSEKSYEASATYTSATNVVDKKS